MNKIPSALSGKILIVGPDFKNHRGGIGAVIETYSTFFEDFKFFPTHRSFKNNFTKITYFFKQLIKLPGYLRKDTNIQIVHIHGSHGASLYRKFVVFFLSKFLLKKKVIYHVHSDSFHIIFQNSGVIRKWVIRTLINKSDGIVCLSDFWFQFFTNNFKPKQITIINNVINAPQRSIVFSAARDNTINFLFLGRIGDRKGLFDLLDVIRSGINIFKHRIKLYVGGDGEVERLETYIKDNNLGGIVEYIGWVDAAKKENYFLKSHVFILPSYSEGLPVSLLEAMSYGMPVLSTNVGGIPEILDNRVNGIMINPGDKEAMAAAILAFLNDPNKITDFGKESLRKVEPYLPSYVSRQLINCYELLLTDEAVQA